MKEFMLLFRGGTDMDTMRESPEQYQQQLVRWKTWMQKLSKDGKIVPGQPLSSGGTVIKGSRKLVTDGPFVEGKETVAGYMLIEAKDISDAVRVSKDCPILDLDGSVEVREIRQLQL